jgi:hypothetical protein
MSAPFDLTKARSVSPALSDAELVIVAQMPPPTIRPTKPMWASRSSFDLPQSLVWEPPASSASMVAAAG